MCMKVAELDGAQLAEWVARALGFPNADAVPVEQCGWDQIEDESFRKDWAPHEDWEQGGPLIEHKRITVQASQAGDWRAYMSDGWCADGVQKRGDTPLIAAMRAYVASKFGDEVADDTK
jgi:hypothetical protein